MSKMQKAKSRLGRGLSSLISVSELPVEAETPAPAPPADAPSAVAPATPAAPTTLVAPANPPLQDAGDNGSNVAAPDAAVPRGTPSAAEPANPAEIPIADV